MLNSEDNFARFTELYRPPVPTNELVESIYSEFEKIFEGNNSFEKFEFEDPELEQDFSDYRKRIGDFNFWETQGFDAFKHSIDNIVIVDLPQLTKDETGNYIQDATRPEPYFYILDIDNLHDIENTKVKAADSALGKQAYYFKTEYVITCGEGGLYYVFDDQYYRLVECAPGKEPAIVAEIAHGLGYCPARSFWTTPLNASTCIQKCGVMTKSLSDLDWLLFFTISERYLQLYAPFPIYVVYKSKCDYKEQAGQKRKCIDGYLESEGSRTLPENRERCPRCKNRIKVGPGNVLELKAPQENGDPNLLENPMKVIPAEKDSLEYMKETLAAMRKEIFANCVGRSKDAKNDQAKNELQVQSSFESSESVLLKVKRNFEIIHEFTLETCARLRYGDKFISASINYGDEFFNTDEDEEVQEYKTAVETGLPEYDLSLLRDDIAGARYRNNPKLLERTRILKNLLPFPDYSLEKLSTVRKDFPDMVTQRDFVVKMKFNEFIDRFEREQANINLFGSALEFDKKISLIRTEIDKYAAEYITAAAVAGGATPAGATGSDITIPQDVEAEAKAKLKGSVGGVQGILAIQASVAQGVTDYSAAVALLNEIFGFDEVVAKKILGTPTKPPSPPAPKF
jgi:hypothetical protein